MATRQRTAATACGSLRIHAAAGRRARVHGAGGAGQGDDRGRPRSVWVRSELEEFRQVEAQDHGQAASSYATNQARQVSAPRA